MFFPQIAAVLNWRNDQNKSGLFSVYLRITINRIARYHKIQIPKKIKEDEWTDTEDCWVKNSHPFTFEINNKIRETKNIVRDLIKRSYNFNKRITFEMIFSHLKRKGDRNSFYDFMDLYIKNPPEKLEENTIKRYVTCLNHLKAFRKQLFLPY